jgi:hypothetical protein
MGIHISIPLIVSQDENNIRTLGHGQHGEKEKKGENGLIHTSSIPFYQYANQSNNSRVFSR